MNKDLISVKDLEKKDIEDIFDLAVKVKKNPYQPLLKDKVLGLIFNKTSTRTRVSFEVGMIQLGGHSLFLEESNIQIGRGETISDTAKVLSRYLDGMVIRTYDHEDIVEYAKHATIPVINGLTDFCHPCQILSDIFSIKEKLGKVSGIRVVFIGDGANNVASSWIFGAAKMGMKLSIAAPNKYWPRPEIIREAVGMSVYGKDFFEVTTNIDEAVSGADVIYTDVFVSMGHDAETERRRRDLMPYQLNQDVIDKVGKKVLVMHCLPAHRGEEIASEVMDGPCSIVFDQAENRLHVQKAVLALLMKDTDQTDI